MIFNVYSIALFEVTIEIIGFLILQIYFMRHKSLNQSHRYIMSLILFLLIIGNILKIMQDFTNSYLFLEGSRLTVYVLLMNLYLYMGFYYSTLDLRKINLKIPIFGSIPIALLAIVSPVSVISVYLNEKLFYWGIIQTTYFRLVGFILTPIISLTAVLYYYSKETLLMERKFRIIDHLNRWLLVFILILTIFSFGIEKIINSFNDIIHISSILFFVILSTIFPIILTHFTPLQLERVYVLKKTGKVLNVYEGAYKELEITNETVLLGGLLSAFVSLTFELNLHNDSYPTNIFEFETLNQSYALVVTGDHIFVLRTKHIYRQILFKVEKIFAKFKLQSSELSQNLKNQIILELYLSI